MDAKHDIDVKIIVCFPVEQATEIIRSINELSSNYNKLYSNNMSKQAFNNEFGVLTNLLLVLGNSVDDARNELKELSEVANAN